MCARLTLQGMDGHSAWVSGWRQGGFSRVCLRPLRFCSLQLTILALPHHAQLPSSPQRAPEYGASALLGVWGVVTERKQSWPSPGGAPRVLSSLSWGQPGRKQHIMSFDRCRTRAVGAEKGPTQPGHQGGLPGGKALRTESCLEISQGEEGQAWQREQNSSSQGRWGCGEMGKKTEVSTACFELWRRAGA